MFSINEWVEAEPSLSLIIPTDNFTQTWFVKHIFWHDNILLIFHNKDVMVSFSWINHTVISMVLTLGITLLDTKT